MYVPPSALRAHIRFAVGDQLRDRIIDDTKYPPQIATRTVPMSRVMPHNDVRVRPFACRCNSRLITTHIVCDHSFCVAHPIRVLAHQLHKSVVGVDKGKATLFANKSCPPSSVGVGGGGQVVVRATSTDHTKSGYKFCLE